ncbi:MAG: MurR/RpiR family transcriptional regulator [Clostridiaceae bacterium]|nr:MurR/RpiR family transcriptional regulator [Clostridiaceae bacterium]
MQRNETENPYSGPVGRIEAEMDRMSKGHKAIARFILSDYERAAYMTAAKIGDQTGVSESTVVRFTMELGYDGYPHFQKMLQEELKEKLTYLQRLNASKRFEGDAQVVKSIIQTDMDNLKYTSDMMDTDSFSRAVQMILSAKKIYFMGLRSSSPLSSFMHFYFTLLFDDVRHIHTNSANEVFEQILPIGPGDLMIGISFPRYSSRTIQSIKYARQRGAAVLAITDKADSPLSDNADVALYARSDMASFVDSLVAPLSLITALIVAVGIHRREHIEQTFEALENLWDEYKVYEKGKDRLIGQSDSDLGKDT